MAAQASGFVSWVTFLKEKLFAAIFSPTCAPSPCVLIAPHPLTSCVYFILHRAVLWQGLHSPDVCSQCLCHALMRYEGPHSSTSPTRPALPRQRERRGGAGGGWRGWLLLIPCPVLPGVDGNLTHNHTIARFNWQKPFLKLLLSSRTVENAYVGLPGSVCLPVWLPVLPHSSRLQKVWGLLTIHHRIPQAFSWSHVKLNTTKK